MRSPNGKTLQITRSFDAAPSEVFQWWAEAEKLQQWSGCNQCISCEVDMDFRVGGGFRQKMKIAVNGSVCDFLLTGTYTEIVVPKLIRYVLVMGQQSIRVSIEFFEEGADTKVVLIQDGFANPDASKIVSQGTHDSLDQLNLLVKRPFGGVTDAMKESA